MRILIDTNIFIYRENNKALATNIQRFLALVNHLGIQIVVHPKSREEIEKDADKARREISLSKFGTYPVLRDAPNPQDDDRFKLILGYTAETSVIIDDVILYAAYRNAVHLLVSEDREILRKAKRLGIKERVLSTTEAISFLSSARSEEGVVIPPAIKHVEIHSLRLDDRFFDSLRAEYDDFDGWFARKAKEGRKCYVFFRPDGGIGALLIYKYEEEALHYSPPQPKKKRLKLCLFKVEEKGFRIGELFIKIAVDLALKGDIEEIYLTHFVKGSDALDELVSEYGFEKSAMSDKGEVVYIKELRPLREALKNLSPLEISKKHWPCYYEGTGVRKFIVPIKPEHHDKLFIELKREFTLFEHCGELIIEGNTIKKAYLCRAKSKRLSTGDILLFYRTKKKASDKAENGITSIGVIDEVYYGVKDAEEAMRITKNRTVFGQAEIEELLPVTLILFTWHFHLVNIISLGELKEHGVLKGPPRSISEISDDGYSFIKENGGIDGRYTIH
jgi:rRNA-processing protein FCF1